ncbi:hypothetical protein BAE44_0008107 [Dichanthelium oligosanthes]|uniref:Uncharacterized protein n=1 Tax=Dichanthelium oligosanthes TaxID=888268 RepID=A0A1E5W0G0_9POAL|nr:hypothetical protein BAE44_0008107 [Dichanthelium oligosanthes]
MAACCPCPPTGCTRSCCASRPRTSAASTLSAARGAASSPIRTSSRPTRPATLNRPCSSSATTRRFETTESSATSRTSPGVSLSGSARRGTGQGGTSGEIHRPRLHLHFERNRVELPIAQPGHGSCTCLASP